MMNWQIDPAHSAVEFSIRHMMIATVRGAFESFSGNVMLDEENPENTRVDVTIDVASINTRIEQRDKHLLSADFFDAENHPTMRFKSTRVVRTSDNTAKMTGDLTIRDVTKPITFAIEYNGTAKSPWGTTSSGFSASGKINRKDWNLDWNQVIETGGILVGEEVKIAIELELIKQEETAQAQA